MDWIFSQTIWNVACLIPCLEQGPEAQFCYRREVRFFTCRNTGSDLTAHTVRKAGFPDINVNAAVSRIKPPQLEVPMCV